MDGDDADSGGGEDETRSRKRDRDRESTRDEESPPSRSEKSSRKKQQPKNGGEVLTESESEVESEEEDESQESKKSSLKRRNTRTKDRTSHREHRSHDRRDRDRDRDSHKDRDRDRDHRERDRDRDRDSHKDRDRDRDRKSSREYDRDRDSSRRDRSREKEREERTEERSRGSRDSGSRGKERKSTRGKKKTDKYHEEEEEFDDGYDEDLMGDDADRRYLGSLSQLERETIISERYEKRRQTKELRQLQKKLDPSSTLPSSSSSSSSNSSSNTSSTSSTTTSSSNNSSNSSSSNSSLSSNSSSSSSNSSSHPLSPHSTVPPLPTYAKVPSSTLARRPDQKKADKDAAISELKARRATKQRRSVNYDDDYSGEESDSGHSESSGSERPPSPQSDSDRNDDSHDRKWSDLKYGVSDINAVRLRRDDHLCKWIDEVYFDQLVGFYVKVGIGSSVDGKSVYKMAEIVGIEEGNRTYQLSSTTFTRKLLRLSIAGSTKTFRIVFISNHDITEAEYQQWLDTMKKNNKSLPRKSELAALRKKLEELKNYSYDEEGISKILEKRKEAGLLYEKSAKRKTKVVSELETARSMEDHEKIRQLEKELKEIEESEKKTQKNSDSISSKLRQINKKNLEANLNIDSMIKKEESSLGSEVDPFSRRPTKSSRIFTKVNKEDQKTDDKNQHKKDENKEENKEDLNKSIEETSSQPEIELDIDITDTILASKSNDRGNGWGGTILKRPLNVTPETEVPTTKRTLSLSDYKRRRGLL